MSAVSFPALRQPVFRAYFFGAASLMMADSIEHVISYWMMFEKFHSPALAGFAVISHWVPFLLGVGRAWGILCNALLYVPFIVWLWKAPYQHRPAPPAVRGFSDVIAAWQAVRDNRVILSMVILVGGASLIVGNAYQAQMPGFAHELGHGDGGFTYSTLFAADAAGALTAGFALESRGLLPPSPRNAFLLPMGWCMAIGGFAAARPHPPARALPLAARLLSLSLSVLARTLVQINAPAPVRG